MTKSRFIEVFGDYPQIRIIDFLFENSNREYTLNEIVEETRGDHTNAYAFVIKLLSKEYVVEKNSKYKINLENKLMKQFLELNWGNGSNSHE